MSDRPSESAIDSTRLRTASRTKNGTSFLSAARADVPFLPMHQEMQEEPDWLAWMEPDGIHLNADGHRWLDQRLDQWAPLREWAGIAPHNTSTPISM